MAIPLNLNISSKLSYVLKNNKSLIYLLIFLHFAQFKGLTFYQTKFADKKPKVEFNGIKKGKLDKLAFFGVKKLELSGKTKDKFEIIRYEFNFSCEGKITLKGFKGNLIDKEIINLVKSCKGDCIADFTNIVAKNKTNGKEIQLNNIQLTVTN